MMGADACPDPSRPGSGTAPEAGGGGADCRGASPRPGSGTAPDAAFAADGFAARPGGFAPACPGSGTAPFAPLAAPSGLGRCTVNGFLHFGHLIDSPAGGTRESSSSYAAEQFGQEIFTRRQSSEYSNRCLRFR